MPLTTELLRALTLSRMNKRTTLPSSLQNILPECAHECLADSIQQTFVLNSCSNTTDLACLCSHYNTEGITLGEASLVCLNSGCKNTSVNATSSSAAYGICSNQAKAVTATHDVLTSFQTATAQMVTTTASVQTGSSSGPRTSSTLVSTLVTLPKSSATTTSVTSSSDVKASSTESNQVSSSDTSAPASGSNSTASSLPPNSQTSTLTNAQAIGVSVGAFGGLGMLVALIFCCICIKRRKNKQEKQKEKERKEEKSVHHSFDFVDRSPGLYAPYPPYLFDIPAQPRTATTLHTPAKADQSGTTTTHEYTQASLPASLLIKEPTSIATRPATQWPISKPRYPGAPPSNAGIRRKPPRPPRPDSNATTVFEEDHRSPRVRNLPSIPTSPFMPYAAAKSTKCTAPRFAEQFTSSPEDLRHPSLSLEIPQMPACDTNQNRLPSPTGMIPDSPLKSARSHVSVPPSSAISYLPSYYTSNDSRTPVLPTGTLTDTKHSPIPVVPVNSPAYINNTNNNPCLIPKSGTRTAHMSYASDTTFESVDPDEVTPPDEVEKRLSDVAESPLSGVRYPKVPRPSNQAIPRSPPQSRWTASSTAFSPSSERQPSSRAGFSPFQEHLPSLLSKRRGEETAQELEQRLYINDASGKSSFYSQTSTVHGLRIDGSGSPSRGGKEVKGKYMSPEMSLKSPLWEPELTPSKRGDDLFISVH